MNSKEWFAEWFDTSYYHQLYKHRNDEEAAFFIKNLVDYLQLGQGEKVLDLACGKGRHSRTLNELGLNVLGVDLSSNSISEAQKHSKDGLRFSVQDMREPIENETFSVIFNLFTSFGYFDNSSENQKVIDAISEMLKPKGTVVIDFMNARKVVDTLVESEVKSVDDIDFHITRNYDGNHIFKHIRFTDKGANFHFTERVQALMLADFQQLLSKDFSNVRTFGDFDLSEFDSNTSNRLIIVAQKN
jgi:2-polyprenyl-3-methyl-5-hydroxy-6-metoxy-1,4-benzoquinol methylase